MTLKNKVILTNSKLHTYFYVAEGINYAPGEEVPEDERIRIESTWNKDSPIYVVEDAAEHFYDDGGWENTWPINFKIWTEDGTYIGDFEVELECTPSFFASKIE